MSNIKYSPISYLIVFLAFSISSDAQGTNDQLVNKLTILNQFNVGYTTDFSYLGFKGKVKQVNQVYFELSEDSLDFQYDGTQHTLLNIQEFDRDGNRTYEHRSRINITCKIKRNNKSSIETCLDSNGEVSSYTRSNYLKNGQIVEHITDLRYLSPEIRTTTYSYGDKGQLISLKVTNDSGIQYSNTRFEYDLQGYPINILLCYDGMSLIDTIAFKYNSNDNDLETYKSFMDSSCIIKTVYNFDENDNLIEYKRYDCDDQLEKMGIQVYDKNRNVIKSTRQIGHKKQSNYHTKYEYDSNGNWIKKSSSDDNFNNKTLNVRTIHYY